MARKAGNMESYPRKATRKAGAIRFGTAFVVLRADHAVLLRTRAPKGLLGGMAEVPVTAWSTDHDTLRAISDAPFKADWARANAPVRHVFTDFPLELAIQATHIPASIPPPAGMRFTQLSRLGNEPLPSVMLKAIDAGLALLGVKR
jgi:A/G-specific adenine glycosylase